jgi:hypothetical protein
MKPYLVTATASDGRRDTFGREAASIEHLRMVLERDGYRDIEFVDDEFSATLRQQRDPAIRPRTAAQFRVEARLLKGAGRGQAILLALRGNAAALLLAAGLAGFGAATHRPMTAAVGVLALLALLWFMLARLNDGGQYDALLRAQACGDYDTAERLIDRLASGSTAKQNAQLAIDLAFRKATIVARRGRLDEALALAAPLKDDAHCANGTYESRVASIYYAADRIAEFVQWMERAWHASGKAQMQTLDLAFVNARFGDCARAAELLGGIAFNNLTAMHARVYLASEGICALRAGDMALACDKLAAAVASVGPHAASAPRLPFNAIIGGYAAIALARAGRTAEATRAVAPWRAAAKICLDPAARRLLAAQVPE